MDNLNASHLLSQEEYGITLELANLTGGPAGVTLAMLAEPGIQFSDPQVQTFDNIAGFMAGGAPAEGVIAVIHYQKGIQLPMAYILDSVSARTLANIMIGGGEPDAGASLSDIQLSAVGEAISQMMAAAANSMSQFLGKTIEISPHRIDVFSAENLLTLMPDLASDGLVVTRYQVTGSQMLPDCDFIQIASANRMREQIQVIKSLKPNTTEYASQPAGVSAMAAGDGFAMEDAMLAAAGPAGNNPGMNAGAGGFAAGGTGPVTVRQVEFPSFENHVSASGGMNRNLELVMDVCLNLTVELGRSELSIKDVLELTRGSVVELNRVAGEPVDLYANGKLIAKGEVVVIEDNFGLRITSIVSPADRLRGL